MNVGIFFRYLFVGILLFFAAGLSISILVIGWPLFLLLLFI